MKIWEKHETSLLRTKAPTTRQFDVAATYRRRIWNVQSSQTKIKSERKSETSLLRTKAQITRRRDVTVKYRRRLWDVQFWQIKIKISEELCVQQQQHLDLMSTRRCDVNTSIWRHRDVPMTILGCSILTDKNKYMCEDVICHYFFAPVRQQHVDVTSLRRTDDVIFSFLP